VKKVKNTFFLVCLDAWTGIGEVRPKAVLRLPQRQSADGAPQVDQEVRFGSVISCWEEYHEISLYRFGFRSGCRAGNGHFASMQGSRDVWTGLCSAAGIFLCSPAAVSTGRS
jgi:hypothetical protein